jgi:Ca2+-binding EF-hand superfamily protein
VKLLAFVFSITIPCLAAQAQDQPADRRATTSLAFIESNGAQVIEIDASIDNVAFDDYWDKAFDAVFAFADVDGNGALDDKEIRLAPSARAVRLALGNGFAPPVASIQSLNDVLEEASQKCTAEMLKRYYRRHRAGGIQVGFGKLPDAAALAQSLIQALDHDKDGELSRCELLSAESVLRKLDTNDDELIGAGELLPNCVYPGCAGTNEASQAMVAELSSAPESRLVLVRLPAETKARAALLHQGRGRIEARPSAAETASPSEIAHWKISISDQLSAAPLSFETGARLHCEAWTVAGPLTGLYEQLRQRIAGAEAAQPPASSLEVSSQRRENDLAWLISLVDRDQDGKASPEEIAAWLEVQRLLNRGQLLVSVIYGGGLFEILDVNHDAGLSPRELRDAWSALKAAGCTSGEDVDLVKAPAVVMMVASRGYPASFGRATTADIEWFRKMDRNSDGDISRREFSGAIEVFSKLDLDHDGLISPDEARRIGKQ